MALDLETKLAPLPGRQADCPVARAFMQDLSERLANRVQLSSDGLNTYIKAVERVFGLDVDTHGRETPQQRGPYKKRIAA